MVHGLIMDSDLSLSQKKLDCWAHDRRALDKLYGARRAGSQQTRQDKTSAVGALRGRYTNNDVWHLSGSACRLGAYNRRALDELQVLAAAAQERGK